MNRIIFIWCGIFSLLSTPTIGNAANPSLDITRQCRNMVPLFEELPVNEYFVTSMVSRQSDDLIIRAACGKKNICLFSFDHKSSNVKMLDRFEALWWDEPCVALGPNGDADHGRFAVDDTAPGRP